MRAPSSTCYLLENCEKDESNLMLEHNPYVICEINTAHFGELQEGRRAIEIAKLAGASAIKFQSWTPESLYSGAYLRENSVAARLLGKFSLTASDLREMSTHCASLEIGFSSTVYSKQEIADLTSADRLDFIKIASMDLMSEDLIDKAIETGIPLVLSTGMASKGEVFQALDRIRDVGSQITVLHCTSLYPTALESSNVGNISWLKRDFPEFQIGFSDHTLDSFASVAAVALGAEVVEKHMTFDKSRPGMDNAMAQDTEEFSDFVSTLGRAYLSVNSTERVLAQEEEIQAKVMRRSAHAAADLPKGHVLTIEDISFLRPGTGVPSGRQAELFGAKLTRCLPAGELIDFKDLELLG